MRKTYSTYEAKARLSEILRQVRERGETVTVTYRGKAIAEIRPVEAEGGTRLEKRLGDLQRSGAIMRSSSSAERLRPVARKPGALDRFLEERDA